ncbi:MAG TPA: SdrD B-like domain-containing protein [Humisphaera sp.]
MSTLAPRRTRVAPPASRAAAVAAAVESLEDRSLFNVVLPGGGVPVGGTTAAARPELAGVVVRDALIPFTVTNSATGGLVFKGQLQDRVVKENATGTLDFYQRIIADPGFTPLSSVDYVARSVFSGWGTDVDFRTDGVGSATIKPESASRSGDGSSVRFAFNSDPITGGQSSRFYFVKTNAKFFDVKGGTAIGMGAQTLGSGSVKLTTAEPVAGGTINGVKFNDLDADGVRDANEPTLSKWQVYLDTNGNKARDAGEPTTFTNANGYYEFKDLAPGTYKVREVQQAGWRQTTQQSTGGTATATVGLGGTVRRDFGNTRKALVSGTVFADANRDGRMGTGESPLAGWIVYLDQNNDGIRQATETFKKTLADGKYAFNLSAGTTYHVRVEKQTGYVQTAPASGQYQILAASGASYLLRNFGELKV